MGAQKNRLNEKVLLTTQKQMFKSTDNKIFIILHYFFFFFLLRVCNQKLIFLYASWGASWDDGVSGTIFRSL